MTTKSNSIAAALVLAFTCVLSASCLRGEPEASHTATPSPSTDPGSEPSGPEPIGEAPQESGPAYRPDQFPFHVFTKDDGKGEAGGSQQTEYTFDFEEREWWLPVYVWRCPIQIEVAIRSELYGRISPTLASRCTAEVANEVVNPLLESQVAWRNQGEEFCYELQERLRQEFRARYPGLGARVHKPR